MDFPKEFAGLEDELCLDPDYFPFKKLLQMKFLSSNSNASQETNNDSKFTTPTPTNDRFSFPLHHPALISNKALSAGHNNPAIQFKDKSVPLKFPKIHFNKENRSDPRNVDWYREENMKFGALSLPKSVSQKPNFGKLGQINTKFNDKAQGDQRIRFLINRNISIDSRKPPIQKQKSEPPVANIESNVNQKPKKDLTRLFLNPIETNKKDIPLYIVHFEGVLGTAHYMLPEKTKQKSEKCRLRGNLKRELKVISKIFLIVIIFPTMNGKYKRIMKYLLKNQFAIDAAYYITERSKNTKKSPFFLNYNEILRDFEIQEGTKVILMQSIDESCMRYFKLFKDLQSDSRPVVKLQEPDYLFSYHRKFPITKIAPENFKILLVPNFTLALKYQKKLMGPNLIDSQSLTYCLHSIYKQHFYTSDAVTPEANQLPEQRNNEQIQSVKSLAETEDTEKLQQADKEERFQSLIELDTASSEAQNISFGRVDFSQVLLAFEKHNKKEVFLREIHLIKKENANFQNKAKTAMDPKVIEANIIDHLEYHNYSNPYSGVIEEYVPVGDLVQRNSEIIREIESEGFSRNPIHSSIIRGIMTLLEDKNKGGNGEQKNDDEEGDNLFEDERQEGHSLKFRSARERPDCARERPDCAMDFKNLVTKFLDCFVFCSLN